MATPLRPMPGLQTLYRNDRIFSKSAFTAFFGIVIAVGIKWATVPKTDPKAEPTFEQMAMPWIVAGGLTMTAVALMILIWRYLRLKKIITEGTIIKGAVDDIEHYAFNTSSENASLSQQTYRHTYWAIVRYTAQGAERIVKVKLPGSGFSSGLAKGHETDLIVHDSLPMKPLIKSVYLGR